MTTVVADAKEGVLVSDSRVTDVDAQLKWTERKVERIGDSLFGFAGDTECIEKMTGWFRRNRAGRKPKVKEFAALELNADGVLIWDHTTTRGYSPQRHYHAIGSGAHAALAAMMMGADAVKAVEVACQIDSMSEGPVQVVRLKEPAA